MLRSHTCGELRKEHAGEKVRLSGWVHHVREHGGVRFIDLRDRYGRTQLVFRPDVQDSFEISKKLKSEDVISIIGMCVLRPDDMMNPSYPTGNIEVIIEKVQIQSSAKPPVFPIEDEINVREETRLRYRYLDLRRNPMQKAIRIRHRALQATRKFLTDLDFMEIETPILMKSTPEGARDYLVPSRVHAGKFYALPQSPQTYKQLLMVSGFDRYFQIARCFRDEDLRADRQPEFTQIDLEMSFVEAEDIMEISEKLTSKVANYCIGKPLELPLPRMTYKKAMEKYGTDKPDIRFGMELVDVTDILENSGFGVFDRIIGGGGKVIALTTEGGPGFSRKDLKEIEGKAKEFGAPGLASMKSDGCKLTGSIAKFFSEDVKEKLIYRCKPQEGDSIFFAAGKKKEAYTLAGNMRTYFGKRLNLYDPNDLKAVWVTNFPLFEEDDDGNPTPKHHPFTQPLLEDVDQLEIMPLKVRSNAYDLCLNGFEIAGGSIRIHDNGLQKRLFKAIGIEDESVKERFGFLLDAFDFGVPPHGGIAFGFDRLVMILAGLDSIRDTIAFPKTTAAYSLMENAPSEVDKKQLKELHIKIDKKRKE
ncbi:MAG: aspartate--tRNA ligase [Candidatus Zixiibacteriota bacterium]